MKKSKKKTIIFIIMGIILLGCIIFMVCSHFSVKKDKKVEEFNGFNFKEVETLEYGFSLNDLVEEEVNCEDACYYLDKELTYEINEETLGVNELNLKIYYDNKTYEHTFKIIVQDTTAPTITLFKSEDSIVKSSGFKAEDYLESVLDNYDNLNIQDVEINSDVNTKKVGNYTVTYKVKDSSGNETSASLIIHVVETKEEVEKNNTNTTNNASTNNNTISNNTNANTEVSSGVKSDLNSVKLNPIKTRHSELDNKVESIISSTTNSNMSNYDKLIAVYDYVKALLSYKQIIIFETEVNKLVYKYHYSYNDALYVYEAYGSLNNKYGVCDDYAALFMVIARRLGFDAYVVNGQAPSQSGGRSGHVWVLIKASGKNYFFDPQIEDYNGTKHNLFGKTESEMKNMYSDYNLNTAVSNLSLFKEQSELKATVTLGGAAYDSASLACYENIGKIISADFFLGETLTITGNVSGVSEYTYELSNNNGTIIKKGSSTSSTFSIDYTPTKEEETKLYLIISATNRPSVRCTIDVKVEDKSRIYNLEYSYFNKKDNSIDVDLHAKGGTSPYTYEVSMIESDNNAATINLTSNDGVTGIATLNINGAETIKFKVLVKDAKNNTYTMNIRYTVSSGLLEDY